MQNIRVHMFMNINIYRKIKIIASFLFANPQEKRERIASIAGNYQVKVDINVLCPPFTLQSFSQEEVALDDVKQ